MYALPRQAYIYVWCDYGIKFLWLTIVSVHWYTDTLVYALQYAPSQLQINHVCDLACN